MVVPKHGHTIVGRNRLRRRLRHIGRTRVLPRFWETGLGLDVLVRARREAYEAPYETLESELVGLTEELCSEPSSSP
jgi:ribonuclease P protein component